MQRLLFVASSCILIFGLLCTLPAVAFAGPHSGLSRGGDTRLDDRRKRCAEALRFMERERTYASEKARYQQAAAERCALKKWYDLGFLDCVLFVPIFGLILPFFGLMVIRAVRSVRQTSSAAPPG